MAKPPFYLVLKEYSRIKNRALDALGVSIALFPVISQFDNSLLFITTSSAPADV